MTNLKQFSTALGGIDEAPARRRVMCEGLFDQYVQPKLHETAADIGVGHRGGRDDRSVRISCDLIHGRKGQASEIGCYFRIEVENTG